MSNIIKLLAASTLISSCTSTNLKRELIYKNNCGIEFYANCDTTVFLNQNGKCEWEFKGIENSEEINEIINQFGFYEFIDSTIVFYTDRRVGIDYGWHKVEDGQTVEFNGLEDFLRDSFNLSNKDYFYRNGQISDDDTLTDIKVDYGDINHIPKPSLSSGGFGIYKVVGSSLKLISQSPDYDLASEDGVFYVTMPGLIDNKIVSLKCQ